MRTSVHSALPSPAHDPSDVGPACSSSCALLVIWGGELTPLCFPQHVLVLRQLVFQLPVRSRSSDRRADRFPGELIPRLYPAYDSGTGMLGGMYFTLDFPTSMAVIWLGTALGVCVSGASLPVGAI